MDYVFLGIFGSGGEKGDSAGDFGAGQEGVPGTSCLRKVPMEVLETGV